jgi:hypothetical protein
MLKQSLKFRSALVLALGLSLVCSGAFAQGNGDRGDRKGNDRADSRQVNQRDNQRNNQSYNQGSRYHYRDGRWYSRGWFGWEFAVAALTIGAIVESLPPQHSTIVVGNTPYYYDNTVYYRQLPDGAYVVVQPPALVSPQVPTSEMLTINVPNSRGGYTAVNLRRSGGGFVGPQGEYYPNTPSVEEMMSGKG